MAGGQNFAGLLTLADVDPRDPRFSQEQLDALRKAAPDKIGPWVVTLNEWRLANPQLSSNASPPFAPSIPKVGRNDPCPGALAPRTWFDMSGTGSGIIAAVKRCVRAVARVPASRQWA